MSAKRSSKDVSDVEIIDTCNTTTFMSDAAAKLGIHIATLTSRARALGVYNPAPIRVRLERSGKATRFKLQYVLSDILEGKHPQYPTYLLSKRLIKENILKYECSVCGISDWNGIPISLELDHINGIRSDHVLANVRMICPNCHSQTDTYKAKNKGKNRINTE